MESKIEQILGKLIVKEFKGMMMLQSVVQGAQEKIDQYGLSPFVTTVMNEEILNKRFLAELFATYDPEKQVAKVSGRVVNVNKDALAAALNLPPVHLHPADLRKSSYAKFLHPFVVRFMFLYAGTMDMVQKMDDVKEHPEMFDFVGFIWWFIENEILQGLKIKKCYCGRHLQRLIRSQHPDLFANPGVAQMDPKIKHILGNLVVKEFKGMLMLKSELQGTKEKINRYGLTPFVAAVMNEEDLNERFLAELFASYDPEKQVARVSGRVVNVNKDALAAALHLPPVHTPAVDLHKSSYAKFLHPFVVRFMFLYAGTMDMVQKMDDVKEHPEMFDFVGFIWWFIENEILKGLKIKKCYCGRHLQCLIRSQHPDLFANPGVAQMDGDMDGTKMDDADSDYDTDTTEEIYEIYDDDDDDDDDVVFEWGDIDDDEEEEK